MAHLWIQAPGGWEAQELDEVENDIAARRSPNTVPAPRVGMARLVGTDVDGSRQWALIASTNADVRVNSGVVDGGLCVLADRDEIRIGDTAMYFSTESLATVEPFPGAERPVYCGRCRQLIDIGAPAVRCPGCGVWYNQSAELPCWTYSEKCVFCPTLTALDAEFAWSPEEN